MTSISTLKAEGVNFFFLDFPEQQMEKNFIKDYDGSNRIFYRLGIYLSCFAWAIWYAGIYLSHIEVFWTALTVLVVVLLVPFIVVVALSFSEKYSTLTHHLVATCNFAAASVCIYVAVYLLKDITFLCAGIICISFFCYFILRIRFKFSLIITLSYAAIAQIIVITAGNFAASEIYTSSSGIWLGFSMAMLSGYFFERTNRKLYVQNKLIEEQYIEREQSRQRQLQQAKEIEKAYENLKSTQNQLIQSEKLASLGELTAGIAHEIQNPLNFVNNFSEMSVELIQELLEEENKPLNAQDALLKTELLNDLSANQQKINHHGKRASSIVSGMLEHSRTSTGERQMTNINKLADEYLRLSYHGMRAKFKDFNADYELIADSILPLINVVPQDIGRVLLNLINNAFYAVSQRNNVETLHATSLQPQYQPTVIVSTQHINNQIVIAIKDNGAGIPADILPKIFQPFFTTKPTGEGTGLGLSLAYDIVTKGHGGTIEVESVEGEGTTFVVKLPIQPV